VGQLAYRILLSWGQQLMLVHKRAPKYFCAQDKFTKYNGTSLCIHLLRQGFFFFLRVSSEAVLRKSPIQCLARNAKYCNILSGTEWSLTTKGTIYCITFALFIFIFLSYCSVISMNQFPNSGKTAFYPSIALLIPWPEYFITSPRHWHNRVFMFQLGNVDKQAEKKKA